MISASRKRVRCINMDNKNQAGKAEWFAIKTRQDFRAEKLLTDVCEEVFFPKEYVRLPSGKTRVKAVIPHVLFIKTTHDIALDLEAKSRNIPGALAPIWIYRYPHCNEIQIIPQHSINLLQLLTEEDTSKCRVYTAKDFKLKERVRVIGGLYEGYEGFVKRIEKNKHVIVSIEGICMVVLPYIHPDLLEKIDSVEEKGSRGFIV